MIFCRTLYRRVCWLLLGLVSGVAPGRAAKPDAVPDWVKAAMALPQGSYPAETNAVVLLDETTLTVGGDGKAVEHHRRAVKILRPGGRDEGMVFIPFDKDSKLLALHVWSVGPDGREYAVKDNEMREYGSPGEGGNLYVDEQYRVANPPGRDPGGVVAYEYDQRMAPYLHEYTWFFQGSLPHVQQSVTLELPAGWVYKSVWAHHADLKTTDLEHQRFRWDASATPGIDFSDVILHPEMAAVAGRMTIHYGPQGDGAAVLGTWQAEGDWYDHLSRDRITATPEIAAKAAELAAGKPDFYLKAEAIAEFVQKDIRYFVIEKGVGGLQPHPAADIFRNRYGDCKDKATLLAAMLGSVGIHAVLMPVDSHRGVVDPNAPSIVGNHVIAAVEIPVSYNSPRLRSVVTAKSGKRYLIVDPTSEKTAFGQVEHNLQGGYGVLVEGKGSEIVQIPVLDSDLNTIQRSATFQLEPGGSLKGAIVEKRFGDVSERTRYLYAYGDQKQREAYLDNRLKRDFTSFSVSDLKVEDVAALNKAVTTSFTLSAERFGRTTGPLLMVRPRVLGLDGFAMDHKPRSFPIDLEQTMVAKDDFTIEVPPGYAVDEMPAPVKLDVGFAAYESASSLSGNSLHYTRTYTVRQVSLPAERYADLQRLETAIDADEQNHAVFKK